MTDDRVKEENNGAWRGGRGKTRPAWKRRRRGGRGGGGVGEEELRRKIVARGEEEEERRVSRGRGRRNRTIKNRRQ